MPSQAPSSSGGSHSSHCRCHMYGLILLFSTHTTTSVVWGHLICLCQGSELAGRAASEADKPLTRYKRRSATTNTLVLPTLLSSENQNTAPCQLLGRKLTLSLLKPECSWIHSSYLTIRYFGNVCWITIFHFPEVSAWALLPSQTNSDIIFDPFNSSPPCFVAILGSSCITSSHVSVAMPYGPVVCRLKNKNKNWNAIIQILPTKQNTCKPNTIWKTATPNFSIKIFPHRGHEGKPQSPKMGFWLEEM